MQDGLWLSCSCAGFGRHYDDAAAKDMPDRFWERWTLLAVLEFQRHAERVVY